jgi:hypothetical protein
MTSDWLETFTDQAQVSFEQISQFIFFHLNLFHLAFTLNYIYNNRHAASFHNDRSAWNFLTLGTGTHQTFWPVQVFLTLPHLTLHPPWAWQSSFSTQRLGRGTLSFKVHTRKLSGNILPHPLTNLRYLHISWAPWFDLAPDINAKTPYGGARVKEPGTDVGSAEIRHSKGAPTWPIQKRAIPRGVKRMLHLLR